MSRFANRAFDLGELGGVLKLLVFEYRIPLLLVPPTCLKLYATGKGNADKGQVMVAMAKIRKRLFSCDDEADAYAAGEHYFPDGMEEPGWYQPANRGLEIKIGEKLAQLRARDAEAASLKDKKSGSGG